MDLGLFNSLSEDTYDLVTGRKGGTSSEIITLLTLQAIRTKIT